MRARSWYTWALTGAAAVIVVELAVVGALLSRGLLRPREAPTPAPSPIVIASPTRDAAASRFSEFVIPKPGGTPYAVAATKDGSVWFTEAECTSGIGRRTKSGHWDHWPLQPGCRSQPLAITVGPDGDVWYADMGGGAYGRIAPDGTFSNFLLQPVGGPVGIAAGPDGNIWIASLSADGPFIEKVGLDGSPLGSYRLPRDVGEVRGIVAGSDGAMWFTESAGIGRITVDGDVRQFPMPQGRGAGSPYQIAAGPDGNLWFVEYLPTGDGRVGRLTTSGNLTEFATPGDRGLQWITRGPDGAMWFTGLISNTIGRIAMNGSVTTYAVPTYRAQPIGITTGPDGKLWLAEDALSTDARLASFSVN